MNLDEIEDVVHAHAVKMAESMRIDLKPHQFRIHFVGEGAAFTTQMTGGSCVHIYTTISPVPADEFNANLRQWLRQIPRLIRKYEMVSTTDVYRWNQENKKLTRTNGLIEELIPTLVPSYRLKTRVITKIVMVDKITGLEEIVEASESEKLSINDLTKIARARLSYRVNEKEKEMFPDEVAE